ncbi:bacterio-opsin activator domain-containing protein [Natrarchaeobius oligotrophus]|uniref:Response regulator n=1 Tax=Natrarchaeobius chitinivorans TaxID=1679083 RepID=A0A3N6PIM0_NATCH|nr:bacterio-opsin activator domain-containing protein [Natrarchaeobius chitinivorans]RQH00750.1 response regulator [Natrarchaeobius chitinivorans]
MTNAITVLVVDNEPGFADLAGEMLERDREEIVAEPATSAAEALEIFFDREIDCIVSDYEMPEMSGIELLERVRETDPELPFILFTGRGSEEVASEAIAAGVTQYLQKETGSEQYALLANQITNAVTQYRIETELRESKRRYERTLATLHETTRNLMRAGTKDEIYEETVATAAEILDVAVAAAYAFDPSTGVLDHAASAGSAREVVDPTTTIERGEGHVWDAFSEGESVYYDDVTRVEDVTAAEATSRCELIVPLQSHGVLVAGTESVDGFDETMTELFHILAANTEAALDRAEREELLREHDRTLANQNEELTRLNHINEVIREINHGVAQASTRAEIERTVCDRLADTDRYRFAWIAASEDDPPEPTQWAGVDATYVDRVRADGELAPETSLIREVLESETVTVVPDVLDDDGWDRRRTEALTYGYQTVLAVPLVDGERRYGVLCVHVSGVDSIGESEREVFAELGETIGHAIRAVERTRAMLTDSRLELELECRDSRLLFNRLSAAVDGPISLEGVLDRDERIVAFVSTPPTSALADLEDEQASIETISIVSESDDEYLYEVTVSSTPFLNTLRTYDVSLRGATAESGVSTLVLEMSQHVETRALVESIRDEHPETELVARRETTGTRSTKRLDSRLEDRLTDKQLEAFQTAYYSGFFEWPRESTGEELAETLEVSAPTYHYHLRAAERKLATLVFDKGL